MFKKKPVFVLAAAAVLSALLAVTCLSGCTSWLAHAIVDAPNRGDAIDPAADPGSEDLSRLGVDRQVRFAAGPPDASISAWVIDPDSEGMTRGGVPRSVLILHGIRDDKRAMLGLGKSLAAAGYRAVLVDLRGHGRSSGDWLTYGVVESRDLAQLIDALSSMGLAGGEIGVIGFSYGGAVAIQLAAADERVKAVVAVAAFSSLAEVVPCYVRRFLPGWIVSDCRIEEALEEAGALAGFDPRDASPIDAIAATAAHVLLIHGRDDKKIPHRHSERMKAAAGERAVLVLVEGEGHDSIVTDRSGVISERSLEWFGKWLGSSGDTGDESNG